MRRLIVVSGLWSAAAALSCASSGSGETAPDAAPIGTPAAIDAETPRATGTTVESDGGLDGTIDDAATPDPDGSADGSNILETRDAEAVDAATYIDASLEPLDATIPEPPPIPVAPFRLVYQGNYNRMLGLSEVSGAEPRVVHASRVNPSSGWSQDYQSLYVTGTDSGQSVDLAAGLNPTAEFEISFPFVYAKGARTLLLGRDLADKNKKHLYRAALDGQAPTVTEILTGGVARVLPVGDSTDLVTELNECVDATACDSRFTVYRRDRVALMKEGIASKALLDVKHFVSPAPTSADDRPDLIFAGTTSAFPNGALYQEQHYQPPNSAPFGAGFWYDSLPYDGSGPKRGYEAYGLFGRSFTSPDGVWAFVLDYWPSGAAQTRLTKVSDPATNIALTTNTNDFFGAARFSPRSTDLVFVATVANGKELRVVDLQLKASTMVKSLPAGSGFGAGGYAAPFSFDPYERAIYYVTKQGTSGALWVTRPPYSSSDLVSESTVDGSFGGIDFTPEGVYFGKVRDDGRREFYRVDRATHTPTAIGVGVKAGNLYTGSRITVIDDHRLLYGGTDDAGESALLLLNTATARSTKLYCLGNSSDLLTLDNHTLVVSIYSVSSPNACNARFAFPAPTYGGIVRFDLNL